MMITAEDRRGDLVEMGVQSTGVKWMCNQCSWSGAGSTRVHNTGDRALHTRAQEGRI